MHLVLPAGHIYLVRSSSKSSIANCGRSNLLHDKVSDKEVL